jgi:hypothetical protein
MQYLPDDATPSPYERFTSAMRAAGYEQGCTSWCPPDCRKHLWQCPGHGDVNPSLSVGEGAGGRVLLNCFSGGCDWKIIAIRIGLKPRDLFRNGKAKPAIVVASSIGPVAWLNRPWGCSGEARELDDAEFRSELLDLMEDHGWLNPECTPHLKRMPADAAFWICEFKKDWQRGQYRHPVPFWLGRRAG